MRKKLLSLLLCLVMLLSMIPAKMVFAKEAKYPYTIFASSTQAGSISIDTNYLCVNGDLATNGTVSSSSGLTINGEIKEHAGLSMVSIGSSLNSNYFTSGAVNHSGNYSSEEMNQNINQAMMSSGQMTLKGNVSLNSAIKAGSDIIIGGQNMNANNCVIYTISGDIIIESDNVSITGLLYAPEGKIEIKAQNINLNNVILLAQTVSLEGVGANINYNESMGRFIGKHMGNIPDVPAEPTVTPIEPTEVPIEPTQTPEEPEEITFSAYGDYEESTGSIEVWWRSNYEGGTYELYESSDNMKYSLVTVVADTNEYSYYVGERIGTNYLKVVLVTEDRERIESVPFQYEVTEKGLLVEPLDSDGDGISDVAELKLGTDINSADSDGDGFTDYQETYEIGTNPTKEDADSDRDSDNDGLTNLEEYSLGTDIYVADSDGDGLSDKEELHSVGTNPLLADTDGDGVFDGDEIMLGTNPRVQDTDGDGIRDGEEVFEQKIAEQCFEEGLLENSEAVLKELVLSTTGNANGSAKISEYTDYLKNDKNYYIGKSIEITGTEIVSGTIEFQLTEEYDVKEYFIDGISTNGLLICYTDGETTIPLDTEFDEATRTLKADISAEGIYFVLDAVEWMQDMGFELFMESPAVFSLSNRAEDLETIDNQAKVIFVIDSTASMIQYYGKVKSQLIAFAKTLDQQSIDVKYALVEYKDISVDGDNSTKVRGNEDSVWLDNAEQLSEKLNYVSITGGKDTSRSALDGLGMAKSILPTTGEETYIVLITDGSYKLANNYEIESLDSLAADFFAEFVTVSVMSVDNRKNEYRNLYGNTGGMFFNLSDGTGEDLEELRKTIVDEVKGGYWIALAGQMPEYVKLDEKPSENSTADTDGDTLTDWEELSGIVPQKTFDPNRFLRALDNRFAEFLSPFPVYNYSSHPGKADTDNDGIEDWEELIIGSDPKNRDTDGDGFGDGYECSIGYNPLAADEDGDGFDDVEELLRGQYPDIYDMSTLEQSAHFIVGYLGGDIIQEPTAPQLYGQILSGVTPGLGDIADIRDTIANAAHGEWGMSLLSMAGVISNTGNVTKTGEKFKDIIRLQDKANLDQLMPFLVKLAQKHPDYIVKLLPTELADELLASLKESGTYSKSFYKSVSEIIVKLGKEVPTGLEKFNNVQKLTFDGVNPWELTPMLRGQLIDKLLGNNLGATFKTYDKLEGTVAISFKSIDTGCKTYQTTSGFMSLLKKHATDLMKGADVIVVNGETIVISQKTLCLVFPDKILTDKQLKEIEEFIGKYGTEFKIEFVIIP